MKPVRLRTLPSWAPMGGLTLGRTIWLKRSMVHALTHEWVHVEQQERYGVLGFLLRYLFSPAWRVRLEAPAYAESVKAGVDIYRCAKALSGPLYLWPCTYVEARRAIEACA